MSERATRRSIVVECRILSEGSRQQATPPRPVDHHTDALLLAARENLLFHPPVEHAETVLDHFNPCRRRVQYSEAHRWAYPAKVSEG